MLIFAGDPSEPAALVWNELPPLSRKPTGDLRGTPQTPPPAFPAAFSNAWLSLFTEFFSERISKAEL